MLNIFKQAPRKETGQLGTDGSSNFKSQSDKQKGVWKRAVEKEKWRLKGEVYVGSVMKQKRNRVIGRRDKGMEGKRIRFRVQTLGRTLFCASNGKLKVFPEERLGTETKLGLRWQPVA